MRGDRVHVFKIYCSCLPEEPHFRYGPLYEMAKESSTIDDDLTDREIAVFEELETQNFETVLSVVCLQPSGYGNSSISQMMTFKTCVKATTVSEKA